jgi:peptidoglycan/LPS O-acetylase OafA/YrhL
MEKTAEYRTALNALRGFAAIYVVLYHLRHYTIFDWFAAVPPLKFGYIGVDFFFLLSGLIISHVYLQKSLNAPLSFWLEFVWLRIARLMPVHLLLMVMLLLAALIGPIFDKGWLPLTGQQISDWFSLSFLVRQWLLPDDYAWNSPAWSVSAELFAYVVVFPVLAVAAARYARVPLATVLVAAGAALFLFVIAAAGTINIKSGAGPLIRVTAGFVAGTGLFLLLNNGKRARHWDTIMGLTLAAAIPTFVVALWMEQSNLPSDIVLIGYLAVLICSTYQAQGFFARFLAQKPLFWLGEISFSLYLCHIPVLRALAYMADYAGIERGMAFGLFGLACSILAAQLLFSLVELPARGRMRRWYTTFWQNGFGRFQSKGSAA